MLGDVFSIVHEVNINGICKHIYIMYRIYFKQAWNLIRQEKFFSLIYIVGTGLSVSMVMVLSIVYYVRIANVYPETNRSRTLVVKSGKISKKGGSDNSSSKLSEKTINTCFAPVKGIEAMALIYNESAEAGLIQMAGSNEQLPITAKFVNTDFWSVFRFDFLKGKPFSAADFQSGVSTAVISENLARRLFGTIDVVGRFVSKDFKQYRVCGVVKNASAVTGITFAEMWIPYTACESYKNQQIDDWNPDGVLGLMDTYLLVAPGADMKAVKAACEANVKRYGQTLKDWTFTVLGQPDYFWQSTFRYWSNEAPDFGKLANRFSLILLIFLMVPSVSLSGMTDSRMERRLAEMGVRRAFGAPRGNLMRQIFTENLLFTLLGGVFGLLLSYLLIYLSRSWIFSLGSSFVTALPGNEEVVFTPSMLINWSVLGMALLVCFILNLLSAMIPAWRAAHRPIVDSINVK